MNQTKLLYIMDPMCSWCWAFRPQLTAFLAKHPEIQLDLIMGGLAPDSDEPMPMAQRQQIEAIWQRIAQQTGMEFNLDFWRNNTPRRSTYPACRAVISAQGMADKAHEMVEAIQTGYYLRALNPSDISTLSLLASELGIDRAQFEQSLQSRETQQALEADLQRARALGVSGFPALLLEHNQELHAIALGYTQFDKLEQRFNQICTDSMV